MAELWFGGPLELPHDFTIDGLTYSLPEIPTHQLLEWLASGAWGELFPRAVPMEQLTPLLLRMRDDNDVIDYEHLHDVASTLFGRLTGLAAIDGSGGDGFWPGRRIAATALTQWAQYAAWCAAHGTRPLDGPLHQVVTAMYGWLRDRAGIEGAEELDRTIFAPPPFSRALPDDVLPRAIRDAEAAAALASLGEALPGEHMPEWA